MPHKDLETRKEYFRIYRSKHMAFKSARGSTYAELKDDMIAKGLYDEYLEQQRQASKKHKKALRTSVMAAYGGKCNCCGETELSFLTIDHVNNDGSLEKSHERGGHGLYRKIIKAGFPDIYQILCFNCNLGKYYNDGTCPHQKE